MAISSSWIIIGAIIWLVAMVVLYLTTDEEVPTSSDGKINSTKLRAKDVQSGKTATSN